MKRTPLERKLRDLELATRRVQRAEGVVAKRNARKVALDALRAYRVALDAYKPPPRKKRRRKRTPPHRMEAKLRGLGWEIVPSTDVLSELAKAGIRTRTATYKTMAPGWAIVISAVAPWKLAACKRSVHERKAVLAEIELERGY